MSVEHYIFEGPVHLKVVEEEQLSQHSELNKLRVVLTSGDEHIFHGYSKEGHGYTIPENGVLEICITPGSPWRTYSSSAWAYVEGDLGYADWEIVD